MKHYQLNGVTPRRHGNLKRRPWNAADFCDKERAVAFIKNFAEVHAIPLPGRMPKFYDYNIMLLPTDASKASVYREYVTATKVLEETSDQSVRCFGYREFCRLWSEVVPFIRVMPPADDLCQVCQDNATLIQKAANLSEEEKKKRLCDAQYHLEFAKKQRTYYREKVKESKEFQLAPSQSKPQSAMLSYSFDYAQQVHYPSNPLQPGPLYFKTPRKCGIFGVCAEGSNTQLNYLIDEAQSCGKGANSVVSMVHHYLKYFTSEKKISLHADNCVAQNKNNIMVSYLMWRVVVGLSQSCELHFMLAGHTRFSPDRFFGLIKRKYRHTKTSSLREIAEIVKNSTTTGQNMAYIIGADDPSKPFFYYNWSEYLSTFFTNIPLITSYHHFRCNSTNPGVVLVSEYADSMEKEIDINKDITSIDEEALPPVLNPSGLSEERLKYLFDQIRPYCDEQYRDVTCPAPSRKRCSAQKEQNDDASSAKRSKRLCSYCRQPGHTKTRKGQVTCPKLLLETGK